MRRRFTAPVYSTTLDGRRPMGRRDEMLKPVSRWTCGLKASFLHAIAIGHLTEAEVMTAHKVSADELACWRECVARGGISDLRLKTIQLRPFRPSVTPALAFHPAQASA